MKHGRFNCLNAVTFMTAGVFVASTVSVGAVQSDRESKTLPRTRDQSTESICDVAARYATEGRLDDLVSESLVGVMTKDGTEDLSIEYQGTAGVATLIAYKAGTQEPAPYGGPALPPGSDNFWGNDRLGLFKFHNLTYILHYRDMTHPVSMIAVTPSAAVSLCRFKALTTLNVPTTAVEPELCKALIDGDHPPFIVFSGHSPITGKFFPNPPEGTQIGATATVDVFNDGKSAHLAEAELSSTAGAGCDTQYIELVNPKETAVHRGMRRDLLVALQNGIEQQCGSQTRLFRAKGKVYAETTKISDELTHMVARIDRGAVVEVCNFEFKTHVTADSENAAAGPRKADGLDQFRH